MKKHLSLISLVLFASFVLSACGALSTPAPTLTPVPPTATPQSEPSVGHWEGRAISFEIGADGQIHNFKIEIGFGDGSSGCVFMADVIPVESDGTVQYTFGETAREGVNTIKGKFESNVTFRGTHSGTMICTNSSGEALAIVSLEDAPISAKLNSSDTAGPTLTPIPLHSIMSTATSIPTETPSGPYEYIVQEGDTCEGIAIDYGVSVPSIIQINNLSADCALFVGQVLLIP
ncbi:MAG: LysM peptidoglycan-binding domain-containing protein [Anaerolineales bacterium]|jgi:LysM repeat protein|nr:LysM peptidoglycan-binding domain-containing protein [Anaerolineales bacterium]